MCLGNCTGFKGVSFRETHLWEHFGQTDQIALITCLKKLNVSGASLIKFQPNNEQRRKFIANLGFRACISFWGSGKGILIDGDAGNFYLVLQACISFLRCLDKSGALLSLPCPHKSCRCSNIKDPPPRLSCPPSSLPASRLSFLERTPKRKRFPHFTVCEGLICFRYERSWNAPTCGLPMLKQRGHTCRFSLWKKSWNCAWNGVWNCRRKTVEKRLWRTFRLNRA